jgi:single-strand DNA-binding protein
MSTRKQIVGNMTAPIDLKFGQSGKAWGTFTVISNDSKDEKATKCATRCKVFGDMAENIATSLDTGARVIVSGREQTEEWETNGEKRSMNVLIVDSIGPDLRFATARVTRNDSSKSTPSNSQPWSNTPASDPWASAPEPTEPPF